MWVTDEWTGCYPSKWQGVVVPEAIAHPAKFSSKLIRRIYDHLMAEGWISEGDAVIDPFGGVALGALDAMRLGLNWTGVELEQKFADLGNLNIQRWDLQYDALIPRWGTAQLWNGDIRNLLQMLMNAQQVAVSSPPYADSLNRPISRDDPEARARRLQQAGRDPDTFSGPHGAARAGMTYTARPGRSFRRLRLKFFSWIYEVL